MKKLLLVSTAIAGMALVSSPASAAIDMDLGGFFRGYGVYADSDETGSSLYEFEFRRDTEIHANGETTLDNGLTIGAHGELKIANGSNSTYSDEIYAYASGGWGRVNFGVEDGAAYLLQVAAPSADSNVDGLRTYIQGFNAWVNDGTADRSDLTTLTANAPGAFFGLADYDHGDFSKIDRLTYLTPKFDGFQAGVSYAPKHGITSNTSGMTTDNDGPFGVTDGSAGSAADYEDLWEAAARYDGEFEGFKIGAGIGYSDSTIESTPTSSFLEVGNDDGADDWYLDDGVQTWNGGLSIGSNGFTIGGGYKHTETSRVHDGDSSGTTEVVAGDITGETWFAGIGYDNGPWHVGGSYVNTQTDFDALDGTTLANDIAATSYENDKYTVGGGYTFGPGMTFRGSVAWGEFDADGSASDSNDFTQVAVGADIQF